MTLEDVFQLVRDARSTKNAERMLLWAIALRATLNEKGCHAQISYELLMRDTGLSDGTLRDSAKRLEDANLIRRAVRSNLPNTFFINLALLQEQAAAVKAADKEKEDDDHDISPFPAPSPMVNPRRPRRGEPYPERPSAAQDYGGRYGTRPSLPKKGS